ncbi:MAG: outer membrane beta-barrel protein [Bryobacteraceae bacterium]|jgi:opacity protein-like surface antigen
MKRSILTLLFVASALTAFAQMGEVSLSFGKSMLRNNSLGTSGGVDVPFDASFHMALRMTLNNSRFFGHEFGYAYNRASFTFSSTNYSMPIHQGFYDFLVYATKEGAKVRPFAAGGAHFSTFVPPGGSIMQGSGITKFGYNYGAGIKAKVSESFMIRLDLRDYTTGKPDFGISPSGLLHQLVVSAGLAFTF